MAKSEKRKAAAAPGRAKKPKVKAGEAKKAKLKAVAAKDPKQKPKLKLKARLKPHAPMTLLKTRGKKVKLRRVTVSVEPVSSPPPPLALGPSSAVLDRLWDVVMERRDADPAVSHSARLLSRGTAKVAQKFGEEAVECLIEATIGNREALIGESADVLYHLIVVWVNAGIRPAEVWAELKRREGVSGIAEKASRAQALPRRLGVATTKIP